MHSDPITCISIQIPAARSTRTSHEEQVRRVFRTSRDMRSHHEKLLNERKTGSTLPSPGSRFSQSPGRNSVLKSQGSDACTETDFEEQAKVARKELITQAIDPSFMIPEQSKLLSVGPRRLLVTAGSVRTSESTVSAKAGGRRRKGRFTETVGWSEPATRTVPFIDFSSAVRTTVLHVEEVFSPSHILRPAVGFYSSLPPKTSPRTKRIPLPVSSSHPSTKPYSATLPPSPLLPEDVFEEALPKKLQFGRTMWKYRGLSLNATAVFDIRPILTWKKKLDEAFQEAVK